MVRKVLVEAKGERRLEFGWSLDGERSICVGKDKYESKEWLKFGVEVGVQTDWCLSLEEVGHRSRQAEVI
jgi:hypothetical protein